MPQGKPEPRHRDRDRQTGDATIPEPAQPTRFAQPPIPRPPGQPLQPRCRCPPGPGRSSPPVRRGSRSRAASAERTSRPRGLREAGGHALGCEETDVIVIEEAHVGDTPREHRRAFDAHAEGETRIALGVDATVTEHLRVDHAAAQELEPDAVFADAAAGAATHDTRKLELQRRLGEREVVRTPLQDRTGAEEGPSEVLERPFEVAHGDALVDAERLDLMKHW